MEAVVSYLNNFTFFDFYPSDDDGNIQGDISIKNRSCFFELPFSMKENKVHNDLLAFSILLCCYPYTKRELLLDFPVSVEFSSLVKDLLRIEIPNKSSEISPRKTQGGRPGLAYSGGVDSTAALMLMPENTLCIFLDRVQPEYKKSMYNKTAALNSVDEVASRNFEIYKSASNMEYMRSRLGFPVDPINADINYASAVPILLSADYFGIDAVSYGAVLETIYNLGHQFYKDYLSTFHFHKWHQLFIVVSCDLFLPVSGVSEVGTSKIVASSLFSNQIRSCMRGDLDSPCGKCIKCFRKTPLEMAINRSIFDDSLIKENLNSVEVVRGIFSKIKHENVYRYISFYLMSTSKFFTDFNRRLNISDEDVSWMERWYPESLNLIPEKYRVDFETRIFRYLERMNEADIDFIESYDIDSVREGFPVDYEEWHLSLKKYFFDSRVIRFFDDISI